MSESEVYKAVSKLFQGEEDLMRDFKSFLPDACLENAPPPVPQQKEEVDEKPEIVPAEAKIAQAKKRAPEPPQIASVAIKVCNLCGSVSTELCFRSRKWSRRLATTLPSTRPLKEFR